MTASELVDALTVSRGRAISALGKAYIRRSDEPDDELFAAMLAGIGLDDEVAVRWLLASWAILREQRAEAPAETNGAKPAVEPASDAQWSLLRRLADEKGFPAPVVALSKQRASDAITELKAGTYDPAKYDEPF